MKKAKTVDTTGLSDNDYQLGKYGNSIEIALLLYYIELGDTDTSTGLVLLFQEVDKYG